MKNLILLLIASHCASLASGQNKERSNYTHDKDLSSWVLDANVFAGGYLQQPERPVIAGKYLNGININSGNIKFNNGGAFGGQLQFGYFFGKSKKIGLGTGLLYMRQWGNLSQDAFHAEYQSTDDNGYIFRQVVSSGKINEKLRIDNFNIPVVLKFKSRLSNRWGITADAGALINIQMQSNYKTDASFDYEAIYKFENESGTPVAVYDYAVTPDKSDFLITREHFTKNNPSGNVNEYFNAKKEAGYHVGLGVKPGQQSGSARYNTPSIGFIFQPSVNYFFSDHVALNIGLHYMYQPFKNDASENYATTGKPGEYNSIVNSASKIQTQSFGGTLGVRFFLGKAGKKMNVSTAGQYAPTNCGSCDGSFTLLGLKPNKEVTVNYRHNDEESSKSFFAIADQDGKVVVNHLCAGNYSDMKATVDKRSAFIAPIELKQAQFSPMIIASTTPTAIGKCDATIKINGLNPGQTATVNYKLNGVKSVNTVTVSADHSAQLTGLCAGSFSEITVESNNCFAALNQAPLVLAEPNNPEPEMSGEDDSLSHVLFDFNKSTIRPVSYQLIDEAYSKLSADRNSYLIIDGNTDKIGSEEYNQQLSVLRANAVRDYLLAKGINSSRIQIKGSGENQPVAPNNTGAGRSKNRRAEMTIKIK